jgi:hypothetical protein
MTVSGQNFDVFQGDTKKIIFTAYDENDVVLDLTAYASSIHWVMYKLTTKTLVLEKSVTSGQIEVPTPTNGKIELNLLPEDTLTIIPGNYSHELEISSSSSDISTISTGIVKIIYSKA